MPTPAETLAALVGSDPTSPRLTWYDDAAGERIELSGAVLGNWVAKAANLLQEDAEAGPGTSVQLALPTHWRAVYWALATWSVGAQLVLAPPGEPVPQPACDVVVGCDPEVTGTASGYAVHVTLPALSRLGADTPPGAVDEARELASYGDRFTPDALPSPDDPALRLAGTVTAYRDVVPDRGWPAGARVLVAGPLGQALLACLAAWAVEGSVVLLAASGAADPARLAAERVSVDAR